MATEELPVFLPGDYCPLIQQSEGTSAEAAAAASASASAAAATARSFQWSAVYVHPSHLPGKDETQNHGPEPAVEVEEAGPCIKARTASVMLPRHVLPPHGPTYVCISTNNRYSPRVGDIVVGIISSKGSEYYGVGTPCRSETLHGSLAAHVATSSYYGSSGLLFRFANYYAPSHQLNSAATKQHRGH